MMCSAQASFSAQTKVSASVSRPWALVLPTSIVLPLEDFMTSPGRKASAETMFSHEEVIKCASRPSGFIHEIESVSLTLPLGATSHGTTTIFIGT